MSPPSAVMSLRHQAAVTKAAPVEPWLDLAPKWIPAWSSMPWPPPMPPIFSLCGTGMPSKASPPAHFTSYKAASNTGIHTRQFPSCLACKASPSMHAAGSDSWPAWEHGPACPVGTSGPSQDITLASPIGDPDMVDFLSSAPLTSFSFIRPGGKARCGLSPW